VIINGAEVSLTEHAQQRMLERRVSAEEVYEVLRTRTIAFPAKWGRTHIQGTVRGRRLRVTVEEMALKHMKFCNVVTVVDLGKRE
jgi:hypothetical protein